MRARVGFLPALATLVLVALLAPASVLAATSEQVAAEAQTTWKQTCVINTGNRTCTGPSSRVHNWNALITPSSGSVTGLRTDATMFGQPPMDPESRNWMVAEEGRETFFGSMWTLGAAVLAWIGLGWVRSLGFVEDGFGVTLLSTAFAAILVAGLEASAFGLMPLRFMPGHAVYKWNRVAWAVLFGLSVFAFVHLLIGPSSGYVSELSPGAFMAALGVFAAFGALSIATWAYFRFRPKPRPAVEPA